MNGMQKVSVHWRAYNRSFEKMMSDENQRDMVLDAPAGASLVDVLLLARAAGLPVGSFQSGIYEVQTNEGMYRRADGMKLCKDPTKGLTADEVRKAVFKTWDQLEQEESNA